MTSHAILDSNTHRDLRVASDPSADMGDGVMSCITFPDEFRRVQGEFPILFRMDAARENFHALAMFGFEQGENLFLDNGKWDAAYRPLALSIQPFLIGRNPDGEGPGQVHVDMEHPRANAAEGTRVFDEDGRPTPYLEGIAEQLGAVDQGYRGQEAFFAALKRHELLEPFTLEITLADGAKNNLVGFHIIDEAKLQALDGEAVAKLHAEGHLMPIFMALASLSQIGELVARKNRREGHI